MRTPADRLNRIVEDGLCIGCGLCESVAGADQVRVQRAPNGELRPIVVGDISDEAVDAVYATCPGVRAEGLPQSLVDAAQHHDGVWGAYNRLVNAWAADPEVRHAGSTGGVLTALGQYLLESGRVAFVLHVRPSVAEPTFGEATISRSPDAVLAGVGSRYGPTAPLINVMDALALDEPFAVIAKPCDLNALRNLAHRDERVNALIRYWLTPVCGGFFPDASMSRFLQDQGIARTSLSAFRYRGNGCPGPTTAETDTGEKQGWHYLDFWGEDETQWKLPFRCKVCPDGIGEGADIVAADTWVGGSPTRAGSDDDPGTNALIVRTESGAELLDAALQDGALACGSTLTVDDLNCFQPHQRNKKYSVGARHEGLRSAGLLHPEPHGLRIAELSAEMSDEFNAAQRDGTVARIEAGGVREVVPVPSADPPLA